MRSRPSFLLLTLSILLAACVPAQRDSETVVSIEPATVVTVERPTTTPPPATVTPRPTTTLLPITLTPTPLDALPLPPPPTLSAIIDDAWVSGYITGDRLEDCPFQVGAFSENMAQVWIPCLMLVPATDAIAAELAAVPPGDTLLQLSGSLDTTMPAPHVFTVTAVAYVNLPYSAQMPLDATYTNDKWGVAIAYPADWSVNNTTDPDAITISSMPPGTTFMRPGREHLDPTEYRVTVRLAGADTLAQWQASYEAMSDPAPMLSQLQIGERDVVRAEWRVYGIAVEYGVEVNGRLFIFHTNDVGEEFMARVVATLQPALYEGIIACGYRKRDDDFDVGSSGAGSIHTITQLTPATPDVAAQLAAFPYGETFLRLQGDVIATGDHRGEMVVTSVSQVTLSYTPETPLTGVYTHTNPAFTFNYPAGWIILQEDNSVVLHNTPEIPGCYRPGRVHSDPTAVSITIRFADFASLAELAEFYQNEQQAECDAPVLQSQEAVTIAGWETIKFVLEDCPFGPYDVYALEVDGQVMVWQRYYGSREFMPRLLATLTVP